MRAEEERSCSESRSHHAWSRRPNLCSKPGLFELLREWLSGQLDAFVVSSQGQDWLRADLRAECGDTEQTLQAGIST